MEWPQPACGRCCLGGPVAGFVAGMGNGAVTKDSRVRRWEDSRAWDTSRVP